MLTRNALTNIILNELSNEKLDMTNYIFQYYVDYGEKESKPFYDLVADAFLSLRSYATLMLSNCWSQAATVLRMAIEQIAKVRVMAQFPELLTKFLKFKEFERIYYNLSKDDQKEALAFYKLKEYQLIKIFDYGWAFEDLENFIPGKNDLLKKADMEILITRIDNTLNAFAHGSISIFQFSGPDGKWELMKRQGEDMNAIAINLFNFLYRSWKHHIKGHFNGLPHDDTELDVRRWIAFDYN